MHVLSLFYLCFIYVLSVNGGKMESEEFQKVNDCICADWVLIKLPKEFGIEKRGESKKSVCKMGHLIFYKNKILFSDFKKKKTFFWMCLISAYFKF